MRIIVAIAVFVCMFTFGVSAAGNNRSAGTISALHNTDSIAEYNAPQRKRFADTCFYQATCIGVPLIVGGVVAQRMDTRFRTMRNTYMPHFKYHVDDYLQYAPAAVMLGVKACGVQGRSSWGRMLVSDAFSVALMTGAVNTLKYTVRTRRPDDSSRNSFPSGHTATAFMTATMLTKEYGYKSPWVGIGAYSVASVTGLMRVANNRHWLSDVLTGAGIGILAVELGYLFADLIFGERGINFDMENEFLNRLDKPLFLGVSLGAHIPLNDYHIDDRNTLRTECGIAAGVEGAYFINPYVGFGGRLSIANVPVATRNRSKTSSFDIFSFCGGSCFSYPLSARLRLDGKLMLGYAHYSAMRLQRRSVPARDGFCIGSGMSLTFRARKHCGFRIFADYNLFSPYTATSNRCLNTLTCGASIGIML